MVEKLNKLLSLGGFLNGSKTWLGILSVIYTIIVATQPPHVVEIVNQLLQMSGISLAVIGPVHKIIKWAGNAAK